MALMISLVLVLYSPSKSIRRGWLLENEHCLRGTQNLGFSCALVQMSGGLFSQVALSIRACNKSLSFECKIDLVPWRYLLDQFTKTWSYIFKEDWTVKRIRGTIKVDFQFYRFYTSRFVKNLIKTKLFHLLRKLG